MGRVLFSDSERVLAKEAYLPYPEKSRSDEVNRGDRNPNPKFTGLVNTDALECYMCSDGHRFYKCPLYLKKTPQERFEIVRKMKLCYNCLKMERFTSKCFSKNNCFQPTCKKRHHTTLHDYFNSPQRDQRNQKEITNKIDNQKNGYNGHVGIAKEKIMCIFKLSL